jgi:hypothetical protein
LTGTAKTTPEQQDASVFTALRISNNWPLGCATLIRSSYTSIGTWEAVPCRPSRRKVVADGFIVCPHRNAVAGTLWMRMNSNGWLATKLSSNRSSIR